MTQWAAMMMRKIYVRCAEADVAQLVGNSGVWALEKLA